jgi:hypothetical protein
MKKAFTFLCILLLVGCAAPAPRNPGPTREDLAKAELIAYRDVLREQVQKGQLTEPEARYRMTQKVNEVITRLQAESAQQAQLRMQAQSHEQQMQQNGYWERRRRESNEALMRSLQNMQSRQPLNCDWNSSTSPRAGMTCR